MANLLRHVVMETSGDRSPDGCKLKALAVGAACIKISRVISLFK